MILLDTILHESINPGLALLPVKMDSAEARVMMLAIGLQESRFMFKYQKVAGRPYEKGPAKSWWQMEKGGGVRGVMTHAATKEHAMRACEKLYVPWDETQIHISLEYNDTLAAVFARLLLWADPRALPGIGNVQGSYELYIRTWRPGKPHPITWGGFYAQAVGQVVA